MIRMTAKQNQILMTSFKEKPQLEEEEKCQLTKLLNVSEKRIRVWFYNKRFKMRRQGLLPKGEGCSAVNENQCLLYSLCIGNIQGISIKYSLNCTHTCTNSRKWTWSLCTCTFSYILQNVESEKVHSLKLCKRIILK